MNQPEPIDPDRVIEPQDEESKSPQPQDDPHRFLALPVSVAEDAGTQTDPDPVQKKLQLKIEEVKLLIDENKLLRDQNKLLADQVRVLREQLDKE